MSGTLSTPLAIPERLFSQAVITQRGLTGRLNQSITVVENGDIQINADAIANPRGNNVVGSYTTRTAYCYEGEAEKTVLRSVKKVMDECERLYFKRFFVRNGISSTGKKQPMIDALMQTVPRVGSKEFIMYFDKHDLVIEADAAYKSKQDTIFQEFITNEMMDNKQIPKLKQIGYGLMRDEWQQMTRPNTYIRIGAGTVLKAQKVMNTFIKSEWQIQSYYMYLLAECLKRFLGKAVPKYETRDWVAVANILVGWVSGFGDTSKDQMWDTDDIQVSVNNVPGLGWTKANRFLWGNVNTTEEFFKYWATMNMLGIVSQRVKAASTEMKLHKVFATNDYMVEKLMKESFASNIDGWGSQGTFYMLMPRNNFSFGKSTDVPMPCIVDDNVSDVDESDRRGLLRYANNYERMLPYEAQSWKDITIDRGEVPAGAIDENGTTAQFIRLHATTDSRILEFADTSSRFQRSIIQWRFPMDMIVDDGPDELERLRLWFWGIFANGEKGQKNAYVIESSLDVFKPQIVNYTRGPRDTMLVDKKGTQTVGQQVVKPGTLSVVPVVESNTALATTVQPPPPEDRSREPRVAPESDEDLGLRKTPEKSNSDKETVNTVENKEVTDVDKAESTAEE